MRRLALALVLACTAAPARAQLAPDTSAVCTYSACALRIEPGSFGGRRLVRGTEGRPAGRITLFRSDLTGVVAASPSAVRYARSYERTRTTLAVVGGGMTVLLALAALNAGNDEAAFGMAYVYGAVGISLVTLPIARRSERALSRAVWHYNGDLPR